MKGLPELGVLAHAIGVAADVHDMAVMQDAVDESCRHHLIAENFTPLLKALVGGEHGGGVFVTDINQLKKQHRAIATERHVVDLIDDQQRRMAQDPQTACGLTVGSR